MVLKNCVHIVGFNGMSHVKRVKDIYFPRQIRNKENGNKLDLNLRNPFRGEFKAFYVLV